MTFDADKVALTSMPRPSPQLAMVFVGNRVEEVIVLVRISERSIERRLPKPLGQAVLAVSNWISSAARRY